MTKKYGVTIHTRRLGAATNATETAKSLKEILIVLLWRLNNKQL